MIKAIINLFRPKPRIDDLDKAVDALVETSMYIAQEKRFAALKVAVETLYKEHRVYKYHGCKRQPRKPKAYEHHAVAEVTE